MSAAHFRLRVVPGDPIPLAPTEAAIELARLEQVIEGHRHGWYLQDVASEQLLAVAARIGAENAEYAAGMRHVLGALQALRSPVVVVEDGTA